MVQFKHDRIVLGKFITTGDPELFSGKAALRKELKARLKDADRDSDGLRLVIITESLKVNQLDADEIADMLSDAAPAGSEFCIRTDERGFSNYVYITRPTR